MIKPEKRFSFEARFQTASAGKSYRPAAFMPLSSSLLNISETRAIGNWHLAIGQQDQNLTADDADFADDPLLFANGFRSAFLIILMLIFWRT